MKIAIVAPLVSAIREPQGGGSQAFVSDLARGLAGRGHEVHVYAATGSEIPGVTVIDTGVDPTSLLATLYRAGSSAARDQDAATSAFAATVIPCTDRYPKSTSFSSCPIAKLAPSLSCPVSVDAVAYPRSTPVASSLGSIAPPHPPFPVPFSFPFHAAPSGIHTSILISESLVGRNVAATLQNAPSFGYFASAPAATPYFR